MKSKSFSSNIHIKFLQIRLYFLKEIIFIVKVYWKFRHNSAST